MRLASLPAVYSRRGTAWAAGLLVCVSVTVTHAGAEVIGVEISERGPYAGGREFSAAGGYEFLRGRLTLAVDPLSEVNGRIADIHLAPRKEDGRVEWTTDFLLLRPTDPSRGNGCLLYDVNNRGNLLALGAFNDRGGNRPEADDNAGNGFLMRRGYSILWTGWNGDVIPGGGRLQIALPVARRQGRTIRGRVYAEICVNQTVRSQPFYWGNSNPYPVAEGFEDDAVLMVREDRSRPARVVPREAWSFGRWEDGRCVPDRRHLCLPDGFQPGLLYELVYTAEDPRVTGLGFATVRDAVSYFRYGPGAETEGGADGEASLAANIDRAIVFGISQSGRFINHFVYEGFNADERARIVFDGAMPHVAGGGRGTFNQRFAQTTRHGSEHQDRLYPSDQFPFTAEWQEDPVTGRTGDIVSFARTRAPLPKTFWVQTSTEYWTRAASLRHTDVGGLTDVPPPEHIRLYVIAGAQHGNSSSAARGPYAHDRNTLDHRPVLRALLVRLDGWLQGQEPPPSRYPRLADGTLVPLDEYRRQFPAIPGVEPPRYFYRPERLDWGPRWHSHGIADFVPPRAFAPYETRVPAVDRDGNVRGGIRLPHLAVPVATYTGWNRRGSEMGASEHLARWAGSQFPFANTRAERERSGDPRLSLEERYGTPAEYRDRLQASARALQEAGFLLEEDVHRLRPRWEAN